MKTIIAFLTLLCVIPTWAQVSVTRVSVNGTNVSTVRLTNSASTTVNYDGTIVTFTSGASTNFAGVIITNNIAFATNTLAYGATNANTTNIFPVHVDFSLGNHFYLTITNHFYLVPTNCAGRDAVVHLKQNATGAWTNMWNTNQLKGQSNFFATAVITSNANAECVLIMRGYSSTQAFGNLLLDVFH